MKKFLGISVLLGLALLAACGGKGPAQPVVVTATPASTVAATADVNTVRTIAAANILATQTASAPTPVVQAAQTQTAPDISATETAIASGSTSNTSGGAPTAAATQPSGGAPTATATAVASATPTATVAAGGQPPPPTKTSAPSLPPGVYVTRLRTDPAQPKRGQPVTFTATFVNSTGAPQTYKWFVQIYDANTNKGFGETGMQSVSVPVGTHGIVSASNWQVTGGGPCLSFYAQAQYQDLDKNRHPFTSTGGSVVSYSFQVCPQ